jgi:UDP-2,3-diacylglucosamine pyrophosphatase LpxH
MQTGTVKIISDLHFGINGDVSNNFKIDEHLFEKYLLKSKEECDMIILNGDIFELWEGIVESEGIGLKRRINHRLKQILNSWCFGDLIRNDPAIHLINGNHDAMIRQFHQFTDKKIVDRMILSSDKYDVFVAHGHQGDFFCRERSVMSFCTCCANEIKSTMEDLINENLDKQVDLLVQKIETDDKKITNYGLEIAKAGQYDAVVFGHTHHPMMCSKGHKLYINDGCAIDREEVIDECLIEFDDQLKITNRTINIRTGDVLVKQEATVTR